MPGTTVTNKEIAAWKASLDAKYNRLKSDYASARNPADKKKAGKKVKATLKELKTWSEIAAAERLLGMKNLPAEVQRMCTELHWLQAFDPDR